MISSGLATIYGVNNYSVMVKTGSEVARRLNLCSNDASREYDTKLRFKQTFILFLENNY
jgi:hypothetical protein